MIIIKLEKRSFIFIIFGDDSHHEKYHAKS